MEREKKWRWGEKKKNLLSERAALTVGGTLVSVLLAASAADADAVDDVALLGLVSEAAGLVGARGARSAVADVQLAELYLCSLSKTFNDCIARTARTVGKRSGRVSAVGGGLLSQVCPPNSSPPIAGKSLLLGVLLHNRTEPVFIQRRGQSAHFWDSGSSLKE